MKRRYCWRVGFAWEQESGSTCDECGGPWDKHREIEQGTCGAFVTCGDYGHPCQLQAEHVDRPHRCEPCGEKST